MTSYSYSSFLLFFSFFHLSSVSCLRFILLQEKKSVKIRSVQFSYPLIYQDLTGKIVIVISFITFEVCEFVRAYCKEKPTKRN